MKALVVRSTGLALDTNYPEPEGKESESLIQVRMAGICQTDLELTQGYMGYEGVLGHEFVGELAENSPAGLKGTRVVGEINAGCGTCRWCKSDMERHCPNRTVLGILGRDGCMAEYVTLPHRNLFSVPEAIPDEEAVFTEPLAAALEIFEQCQVQPHERVCVLGDGKLGLMCLFAFAGRHQGELMLVGHHRDKLELAADKAEIVTESELPKEHFKQWDYVVDATGKTQGLINAMQLVRPRGVIVLKSTMAKAEAVDLTPAVIDEVTVVGSRCGRFQPALKMLAKRAVPVERLIESIYSIEEAEKAWEKAKEKGSKKVILQMA